MAAREAPYFKALTERDVRKADMYREAALARGHPPREVGDLYPEGDEVLRSFHKDKKCVHAHAPWLDHPLIARESLHSHSSHALDTYSPLPMAAGACRS